MALLNPDYSEEFRPLTDGTYTLRVKEYKQKSSEKGRYLNWILEVIDDGEFQGSTVQHNTPFEGRGAGMLKHFLKTCDGQYEDGPFDPDHYIGSRIGADVFQREYNGKTYPSIKELFPLEDAGDSRF